ncbi:hypothetical protein [Cutibacterium sp. V947]|uniref:hypothetical protein n=1 Tax=Cutibacterium sp. V947 TaxID=3446480 RepID=UPI003EDEF7D9
MHRWMTGRLDWRESARQVVDDEIIEVNPRVGVRLPAVWPSKLAILSIDQVDHIATVMTPRQRSMVVVVAATGMRQRELRGLTWDRVAGDRMRIDRQLLSGGADATWGPPKTPRAVRTIALGRVARQALEGRRESFGGGLRGWCGRPGWSGVWPGGSGAIVTSRRGGPRAVAEVGVA